MQTIRQLEDFEVSVVTRTSVLSWEHGSAPVTFSIIVETLVRNSKDWKYVLACDFRGSSLCSPHALG